MSKLDSLRARMEKRAYGGGALLSDLLASGAWGLNGLAIGTGNRLGDRSSAIRDPADQDLAYATGGSAQHLSHLDEAASALQAANAARFSGPAPRTRGLAIHDPGVRDSLTEQLNAVNSMRSGIRGLRDSAKQNASDAAGRARPFDAKKDLYDLGGGLSSAGALATSLLPVNNHYFATPLMTTLGGITGQGLSMLAADPSNPSPILRGLGGAGGALAGRMALRGYDALKERGAKKKQGGGKKDKEPKEKEASFAPGTYAERFGPASALGRRLGAKVRDMTTKHTADDEKQPKSTLGSDRTPRLLRKIQDLGRTI